MKQYNVKIKLHKILKLVNGKAFKSSEWGSRGLPIIRIQNLNGSKEFNHYNEEIQNKYIVNNGDLLFSWSGSRGTSFGPHIWSGEKGVLNQHIFKVIPKIEINKFFLFYELKRLTKEIEQGAHGSAGLVHITKSDLEQFEIYYFDLFEQQKIAKILFALELNIEKTTQIIKKYKKIKNGLMDDLLTGKIRYKNDEWVNETDFKEVEGFGRVPKDWCVGAIEEQGIKIIDGDRGKNYPSSNELYNNGYCVFLNNKNIHRGKIVYENCDYISYEKDNLLRKGKLEKKDIIITTRGSVGNIAIYLEDNKYPNVRINSGMVILRNYKKKFIDYFLINLWMFIFQKIYYTIGSGSAQPQLPIKDMKQIKLVIPDLEEQKRIANVLSKQDQLIEKEEQYLQKLQKLKAGLMDDLLTGKVRVKLDD